MLDRESAIRRRALRRTVLANAGLLAYSVFAAAVSGNKAFMAEAIHDAGDTTAHGLRWGAESLGIDQHTDRYKRFRKATFYVLSGLSAYTAVRIGLDISNGVSAAGSKGEQWFELASAGAVAGGNVYAWREMEKVEHHSHASHDSRHHARTDMAASLGLATCIAADVLGARGMAEVGGTLFAGYTAIELFPTEHKLEHHDH